MCAKLFYTHHFTSQAPHSNRISSFARAFIEHVSPPDNSVHPLSLNCVICWPASDKGGTHEKEGANNLDLYYT